MKVVSFHFKKISIEKSSENFEKINVNSNIDLKEITSLKQDLFKTDDEIIGVKFSFTLEYEPNIAKIELGGDILLAIEPKMAKSIIKDWKDGKKVQEDFRIDLFNVILRKAHLKALELEDELNLPVHMSFPMIKKEDMKDFKNL